MERLQRWIEKSRQHIAEGNPAQVFDQYHVYEKNRAWRNMSIPGKAQFDDAPDDLVDAARLVSSRYLAALREHNAALTLIDEKYKGDAARKKHDAQMQKAPRMQGYTDLLALLASVELVQIEAQEALAMETPSPDYKFLELPVQLTAEELTRLHARNKNDPMFCRALTKYVSDGDYEEMIDTRDSLTVKRAAVENLVATHRDIIKDADGLTLALLDTMGINDNYKAALVGTEPADQPDPATGADVLAGFNEAD